MALSRGSPRVGVTHHLALWSPDLPRQQQFPAADAAARPARPPSDQSRLRRPAGIGYNPANHDERANPDDRGAAIAIADDVRQIGRLRLWAAYLSGGFGLGMQGYITFLVPLRAHELGAGYETIGLIAAVGTLAPGLLAVSLGALIDRIGPKRGFTLGACASMLIFLVALLVTNYWWFLALQPFVGLAQTFGWLSSQGHITSLGTPEQRPMLTGRFSFFVNVGQMASPVLAGIVAQSIGLRWAFLVPAMYAAFFVVLSLVLIDTRPSGASKRTSKDGGLRSALQLTGLRGIQVALLLTFARLWIATVFNTFVPVYLVGRGFSTGLAGTVVATASLVAAVMAPTTGYWTRHMCSERATMLGLGCGAVSLLLVPHIAAVPVIYIAPVLWGVALGTSLPLLISIVTSAAPAEQRGVALGLRVSANKAAATGAPVLVGPLIAALGMALGFTVGGALALGLLAGSRLLHRADRRAPAALVEAGVTPP